MITTELILALNPRHPNPKAAADALQQAAVKFGITDPRSVAAWLANLMVESNLVPQRENMYYTDPNRLIKIWPSKFPKLYSPAQYIKNPEKLGNLVYAGYKGNGDVTSGDGYRYRGGGLVQRTGKNGFALAQQRTGLPFLAQPKLMEQYGPTAMDAAAYWTLDSSADRLARAGDIRGTRRAVNGAAMLHADLMLAYYAKVLPLVQQVTETPRVILINAAGQEVPWNGKPDPYGGVTLTDALIAQLRTVYPQPGGPWQYGTLKVYLRRNGDLVLEKPRP